MLCKLHCSLFYHSVKQLRSFFVPILLHFLNEGYPHCAEYNIEHSLEDKRYTVIG